MDSGNEKSFWVGDVEVFGEEQDPIEMFDVLPDPLPDNPLHTKYVFEAVLKERAKSMRSLMIAQGLIRTEDVWSRERPSPKWLTKLRKN